MSSPVLPRQGTGIKRYDRPGRRSHGARLIEFHQEAKRRRRKRNDDDQHQGCRKLAPRAVGIIFPDESRVGNLLEMIRDRHGEPHLRLS